MLSSIRAYNGGTSTSTVTASCTGQTTASSSVAAGQLVTIPTNWSSTCSTVTLGSTNGWSTIFDDFQLDASTVQTAAFDDLTGQNYALSGQDPTGVIDWGNNNWYVSGPYAQLLGKSISFNGAGPTTRRSAS